MGTRSTTDLGFLGTPRVTMQAQSTARGPTDWQTQDILPLDHRTPSRQGSRRPSPPGTPRVRAVRTRPRTP
eukprot:6885827-Pyramimonas_sp.AAC.1